jgi:nucleoside-diphosphate kinase
MSGTKTYAMIKPHAVAAGHTGQIIDRIEREGFKIVALKKTTFSKDLAQKFYAVHAERPFYNDLVNNMSSGPVIAMILEKADAVAEWRTLIGATNPAQAAEGTLRKQFGESIDLNVAHGSDADATAEQECALVFPEVC